MPSTSAKQAKFMRAVAHSPKFAKQVGVPQSVGKDFNMADKKTKKFGAGGRSALERETLDPRKAIKRGEAASAFDAEDEGVMKLPRTAPTAPRKPVRPDRDTLGVKKATPYAKGGKTMKKADKAGRALVKKSADTMGRAMKMACGGGKMKKYASGGGVFRASANGIASKGKTKGTQIKMAKGGKAMKDKC